MSLPAEFANEIKALESEILKHKPSDIVQFCANHFHKRLESQRSGGSSPSNMASGFSNANPFGGSPSSADRGMHSLQEEDENDEVGSPTSSAPHPDDSRSGGAAATLFGAGGFGTTGFMANSTPPSASDQPANYNTNRRVSVSAESMDPSAQDNSDWKPPNHPKTPEQEARLKQAIAPNFLFSHLEDELSAMVLGALTEKTIPAKGIKVISQGDAGDYFYIIEKGAFDVYVNPSGQLEPGADGMGKKVTSIGPGGSFGELALMYNAPRAATVVSTEASTLWALDRVTFRRILMDSAFQRRRMYESFLEEVELLSGLTPYERSKIADALHTQKYPAGSTIIAEGDPGESFYLLESGECEVFQKSAGADPVHKYSKGDYFGELALLNDKPRAASVISKTEVKVAALGKEGFQRLLGPVETLMRRNDPSKQPGTEEVDPLAKS